MIKNRLSFAHKTKEIKIASLRIGADNPIVIQSMTNTDTRDTAATIRQIKELEFYGCELVRVAVLDEQAATAIRIIKDSVNIPIIADIHFDSRLAVKSLEVGADGLRINPGNIGTAKDIDRVVSAAKMHRAVIRIGVNSGSLEKKLLLKYGKSCPEALVESALSHVKLLESRDFFDIKISLKSSSVLDSLEAYRLLAEKVNYPLHIGITEAGTLLRGTIKSCAGLSILLWQGIGDTLRISLTADPVEEVKVAWGLLSCLGLRCRGVEIISCPTCGRTELDLLSLVEKVEKHLENETLNIKVAVMGCIVNGPGEAREADIGLAGGRDKGIIFKKGKIIRSVTGSEMLLQIFMQELDKILEEKRGQ